eukprot:161455-Chlamydomonas_euryale.AAC.1
MGHIHTCQVPPPVHVGFEYSAQLPLCVSASFRSIEHGQAHFLGGNCHVWEQRVIMWSFKEKHSPPATQKPHPMGLSPQPCSMLDVNPWLRTLRQRPRSSDRDLDPQTET